MNRKHIFIFLIVLIIALKGQSKDNGQVIKGKIIDAVSQVPLPGASIVILESQPLVGTVTEAEGNFKLMNIAPGRYNLLVSFIGYENYLFREVLVGTGKEVVLNAGLKELPKEIDEVKVISRTSKELAVNP
ncbi:MAG TPA: carboxypeptidase-like regulatory domain-containing protein, partial [Prolixibacteraceae bacterium]|nr:carboxypeptidase-like regulatory domain-containing protein [Prolixibacteraceae bacterium]